ncbi:rRNA methyltransferase 1, mitochondrial [Lecanosticta acicola]|uniref:rRNA methyltransferase 1, mitochondrial n=1 Tax=Lecanosticta acicola TaxID=111012 RepID=A0AAI8W0I7_9PEZI|nr:rRNA methyltransferase 1, mitochondrial [Lecanosticta acicola]
MVHVQRLEGSRGPRRLLDRLKSNIRGHIRAINVAIETGTFKTEAEDSVAEMFMRKADDRIFRVGPPAGPTSSTIYQKEDGTMDVYYASEAFEFGKYGKEVDFGNEEVAETPQKQSQDEPEQTSQSSQDHIPVPIPYSTAASEFLYGYNPVLAALRGRRRKMYKLYIHPHIFPKDFAKEPTGPVNQVESARANLATLARDANVTLVNKVITQQLDRMSDGRPHNGVVLEVSKLPAPPVLHLSKPDLKQSSVRMELAKQSAEEAAVNGTSNEMQIAAKTWRYPLVVMLDGILDPANVGSIIRTCHFYGVDAVAVATNTCANLSSPIVAKASSGGCEAVRLLSLPKPSEFVYESGRNGWSIYAAEASSAGSADKTRKLTTSSVAADSPLAKHPCILMLGAEGEGLRENLRKRADGFVAIQSSAKPADMGNVGVDSLNVGVAAGILLESFLSRPAAAPKEKDISGELGW